jgi:hypothetical protein
MKEMSLEAVLGDQLSRILADTAFILVEDRDSALPEPEPAIEASLSFSGRQKGTCWLAVSKAGADYLAKEMLGEDLAVDPRHCEQAVLELLNILTGWVLDTWWGEDVAHDMGTPVAFRKPFDQTVCWSLPQGQRVVVATDPGYTFICGVTAEG